MAQQCWGPAPPKVANACVDASCPCEAVGWVVEVKKVCLRVLGIKGRVRRKALRLTAKGGRTELFEIWICKIILRYFLIALDQSKKELTTEKVSTTFSSISLSILETDFGAHA